MPSRHAWAAGAILLFIVAAIRIAATWSVFTATFDEPFHVAMGLEWLTTHSYTHELEHPPLGRVALAIGPYLRGLRAYGLRAGETCYTEGNAVLYSNGQYWENLRAARAANLFFLAVACAAIFLWARRWFTPATGFWAVLLFLSLPPILGHAGLATLDMACAASVVIALYQFVRWIEAPTALRSAVLGAAMAFALLCKFSSIPFLDACVVGALVFLVLVKPGTPLESLDLPRILRMAAIMAGVTAIVVLAAYWFSVRPLVGGILQVFQHNAQGHWSYLLGEVRMTGWWYFFPIVMAVKTPIGLLVLVALARTSGWQRQLTALFPAAILAVCMIARINLGVRHILVIYCFMALLAAHAIRTLFEHRKLAVIPLLLTIWVMSDCWRAHPDYMAWFNPIAGAHPEKILVESDLDWGQDLDRLTRRLRELNVQRVGIQYFGSAALDRVGLPSGAYRLQPRVPTHGWVAISIHDLKFYNAWDKSFAWLIHRTPRERVGKSIELYYIP